MKEKILKIIKNPIIITTFSALVLMVVCGVFSSEKPSSKCPDVVVEFCDALTDYEQDEVIELLCDTNLLRYHSEKDVVIRKLNELLDKKGVKVSYTLGAVQYVEGLDKTPEIEECVCRAMLVIREKGEVVNVLNMTFRVRESDGEEKLILFTCPELVVE